MNSYISSALLNWLPYKLNFIEDQPYCEWLYTGDRDFTEPFLGEPSHAKYPEQVFAEHAVHGPVPDYCKAAYDKYEALEKIRNS